MLLEESASAVEQQPHCCCYYCVNKHENLFHFHFHQFPLVLNCLSDRRYLLYRGLIPKSILFRQKMDVKCRTFTRLKLPFVDVNSLPKMVTNASRSLAAEISKWNGHPKCLKIDWCETKFSDLQVANIHMRHCVHIHTTTCSIHGYWH